MGKTIKITINPVGHCEVEADGFTDNSCHAATKAFQEALGGKQDTTDGPEASVPATNINQHQHGTW